MKRRLGKGIRVCAGILAALFLAGCSAKDGKQEGDKAEEAQQLVYQPEFADLVCELDAEDIIPTRAFYYMFVNDKAVYGIARHYDSIGKTMNNYLVVQNLDGEDYSKKELGVYDSFYETSNGFAGYGNGTIKLYDENFEEKLQIELSGVEKALSDKGEKLTVDDVNVDEAGNVCIKNGSTLVYTDAVGTVQRVIDMPANANSGMLTQTDRILVTPSGEWYLVYTNNTDKIEICSVDMENGVIGERLVNVPDVYIGRMRRAGMTGDGELYIVTEDYIYMYNSDNTDYREVFCLRDYGIGSSNDAGKSAFGVSASGGFYIASVDSVDLQPEIDNGNTAGTGYGQVTTELAVISGKNASDVNERREIVMSAFTAPTWVYAEPINKFNRYNKEYYLTVKSYFNYDENEYDTALTRFYNDLITGNGADLFWFNIGDDINIDNLADKGVLADLYTYLDSDSDMDRDDFIHSILSAVESDGKLYVLPPEFSMVSIVGKAEFLDGNDEWSFSKMYNLLNRYNGARLFLRGRNDMILDSFLRYSMDLFYDKDTGECSFESDEFIDMLKLVQAVPDTFESVADDEKNDKLQKNEVLFSECSIDTLNIKQIDLDFNNIEKAYLGYPSKSHSQAAFVFSYNMALNNMGSNKDAAWNFMKYYLENFESTKLSVFEDKFEAQLDEAMHEYDGESGAHNALSMNLTQEQADTIRRLADTASGYKQYDMAVYNIVYEEAMSFISGQRSAGEAAAIIQDRVKLYLDEQD